MVDVLDCIFKKKIPAEKQRHAGKGQVRFVSVEEDISRKHSDMTESPFPLDFLRIQFMNK